MYKTINEFFAGGNHLLTSTQITNNEFDFFGDNGITGGLTAFETVVKLKYGKSSLLPVSVSDIQDTVCGVLIMYREKYNRWCDFLKTNYPTLQTYKRTEQIDTTNEHSNGVSDTETKSNTGTQTTGVQSSNTRTDNLTEQTTHGATVTQSTNSYNNAGSPNWKGSEKTENGGSDTINNTGTQTDAGNSTTQRTDNLTQGIQKQKRENGSASENIDKVILGYDKAPAEIMLTELRMYENTFLERMANDVCNYITFFDFDFGG